MKFFSLFTGIGGLDMGLEELGAKCVGFSDIKESSVRMYLRHYPDRQNYGDITKVDPTKLPDFNILTGGFPCQSFSLAGLRKGFGDRRGKLIFYVYDILLAKKPEFVVLENVKGIVNHDNGQTYNNVFRLLQAAGYYVRVVLLNSAHYGSAQSRERVFFLCRRNKDFPIKQPVRRNIDATFRDIRDTKGPFRFVSDRVNARIHGSGKWCVLLGGYDKVNTLTTNESSCGKDRLYVQEPDGRFRGLSILEGERLQGFPDLWTDGESLSDRWYAVGNAVNCQVSRYLFLDYLKGLWW